MVDRYQRAALATPLHIPLLYGIDTVHGDGNMDGATVFPHNIGLGATRDPALVRRVEHVAASETRSTGPQWAFAPCICVARDDRWGRTYESFGEKPSLVERMETAIDGFQGPPGHLSDNTRVLATAKHFAGDGLTTYGTGSNGHTTGTYPIDQGVDQVSHRTFRRLALAPYVPAVRRHHVGAVMPSYSDVDWTNDGLGNRINMHGNRSLITGWLKQKEGFKGIVISDYNGIDHINPTSGTFADRVAAGGQRGHRHVHAAAELRGLRVDARRTGPGRHGADGPHQRRRAADPARQVPARASSSTRYTDRTHLPDVGDAAHRAVARRAVSESQVLLRNRSHTLPLRPSRPVYVAGSNADSMGNQAGGWTLQWQGDSSNQIPGHTILDGIESRASDVTYSAGRVRAGAEAGGRRGRGRRDAVRRGRGRRRASPATRWSCRDADAQAIRRSAPRRPAASCWSSPAGPIIIPPTLLKQHRLPGGVVAARLRGRGSLRRPLRRAAVHRQAAGDLAQDARTGADQHRRRALPPALPVRLGAATRR